MTSRPVSGERFLVALNLLPITFKSRDIIQEKLWIVCNEIKEWELRNKNVNDNKTEKLMDRIDFLKEISNENQNESQSLKEKKGQKIKKGSGFSSSSFFSCKSFFSFKL